MPLHTDTSSHVTDVNHRVPSVVERHPGASFLRSYAAEWDALAAQGGTPFSSSFWLLAWTEAFGERTFSLVVRDGGGGLCAGGHFVQGTGGRVRSADNAYSDEWDLVGTDLLARRAVWRDLADRRTSRLAARPLPDTRDGAELAASVLHEAGHEVLRRPDLGNPRLPLPGSWDELLAGASKNLRSQLRRRSRDMEATGTVVLRTSEPYETDRDLDTFLRVEASGWKGRNGTAVANDDRSLRLYRQFVREASARGLLRLHVLEVDGTAVAADICCVWAGGMFMLKTTYDEAWTSCSPGLVMTARSLQDAIGEGLEFYDFLGGAESYKLRWGAQPRGHVRLDGYRGPWRAAYPYRRWARPLASRVRHQLRRGGTH